MSYQAIWQLTNDQPFIARCRACIIEQSGTFINDGRPQIAALAASLLRSEAAQLVSFEMLLGVAPTFADRAVTNGTVDSSPIADADILSAVQAQFPTVASLYFNADGSAKP